MRISIRFLLFATFFQLQIFYSFAQSNEKSGNDGHFSQVNFVEIRENLFACRFETNNEDYVRFLEDVKFRMNPTIYKSLLPDSARWSDQAIRNPRYSKEYLHGKSFADFPVVNISYEQANFYCNWLTQQYNKSENKPYKKVVFRLPSRNEWVLAATSGNPMDSFPWGERMEDLPKGVEVYYCHPDPKQKKESRACRPPKGSPYLYSAPVNHPKAKQSRNGLYHIAGNVSEMISSKGDCAGGNFRSPYYWLRTDASNEFHPGFIPCPLVGFRVFMQVLEH